MIDYDSIYNLVKDPVLKKRFHLYKDVTAYIDGLIARLNHFRVDKILVGDSVMGKPIYGMRIGNSGPKILVWSQMHGNESTMTRALFLYLESLVGDGSLLNCRLYIIPVLNPDGNDLWVRNNANDVDLNRDAIDLSQPESIILREIFLDFEPDFCFNLHDQRSIYGTFNGDHPIPVSFLSPAGDEFKTISPQRLKAMGVINVMTTAINSSHSIAIGRYNDTYNAQCVGDHFTSKGVPTVLFEAGQWSSNYNRDDVVLIMSRALFVAIDFIGMGNESSSAEQVYEQYMRIPEISHSYCDILLTNYPCDEKRMSLGVMYKEVIDQDTLCFVPVLTSINDNSIKNAHLVIDCSHYTADQMDVDLYENQVFTSKLLNIDVIY